MVNHISNITSFKNLLNRLRRGKMTPKHQRCGSNHTLLLHRLLLVTSFLQQGDARVKRQMHTYSLPSSAKPFCIPQQHCAEEPASPWLFQQTGNVCPAEGVRSDCSSSRLCVESLESDLSIRRYFFTFLGIQYPR